MKTIVVHVEKVISHGTDGMPVIEKTDIPLTPEMTFNKFVKYLPNQGYRQGSVKVLDVFSIIEGKTTKLDEIDRYQDMIDNVMTSKANENVDYKALSEKQSKLLAEMEERLKVLESKGGASKSNNREALEEKANELGISFRSTIGDEKLLDKIKEVEPDYKS